MEKYLDEVDLASYRAFANQDRRVSSDMMSSASMGLDLWENRELKSLTASDGMDIDRIRTEKTAVYLIVPEDEMDYYGPVLNLFYLVCFRHCLRDWRPDPGANAEKLPVYFFLDEFAQLGRIDRFANIITTLRKRRCSVSIVLQNLAQLDAVYGRDDAESIFSGGCANKLFFPGLDVKTCRHVEEALGNRTDYDTILGGISDKRTLSVPLLRTDEMRMMGTEQGVLISGQYRPALLKMPPYFRVPEWLARSKKPPVPVEGRSGEVRYFPIDQFGPGNRKRTGGREEEAREVWEAEVERMAGRMESAGDGATRTT